MIPCVVLASTVRGNATRKDLDALKKEYFDFVAGQIRSSPVAVVLCEPGDQDGGNGSSREPGGGAMHPLIATLGKTFFDFTTHPSGTRQRKFPKNMRFELCLPFLDLGQADLFLRNHDAGKRLGRVFEFVEIVALSAPAFAIASGAGGGAPA